MCCVCMIAWNDAFGALKFLQFILWKCQSLYSLFHIIKCELSIRICACERCFDFDTHAHAHAQWTPYKIIFTNNANMVTLELEEFDIWKMIQWKHFEVCACVCVNVFVFSVKT